MASRTASGQSSQPFAGRNIGDDIIYFVLCYIGNAQFMETADDIIADAFFMVGRTDACSQSCKFVDDTFNDFYDRSYDKRSLQKSLW